MGSESKKFIENINFHGKKKRKKSICKQNDKTVRNEWDSPKPKESI